MDSFIRNNSFSNCSIGFEVILFSSAIYYESFLCRSLNETADFLRFGNNLSVLTEKTSLIVVNY